MIAHVVLFRPKADLSTTAREAFFTAIEDTLAGISAIRRISFGVRRRVGRPYDLPLGTDFPFLAWLEFDDERGLREYLDHPAHDRLAAEYYSSAAAAMAFDFDLVSVAELRAQLQQRAHPQ